MGLSFKSLELQALALKTRWEWLWGTDPMKPYKWLPMTTDLKTKKIFEEGLSNTLFWGDNWIDGNRVKDIDPLVLDKVSKGCLNPRTEEQGILETLGCLISR